MLYDSLTASLPPCFSPFLRSPLSPFLPYSLSLSTYHAHTIQHTYNTHSSHTPASLVRERHFITLCSRTTKSPPTPRLKPYHRFPPCPFPFYLLSTLSCKYKYNQIIYNIAGKQPFFFSFKCYEKDVLIPRSLCSNEHKQKGGR